ncbi:UDP:flavonoid glycosyltransferase YjiC, YdhE family [Faunimonas pinastri]|uniref:UDP:flavonoid glycosyltransferase YjiC, YdhE family n=1 Tax=Faunimonas pinastri TaxID=1855383 RepID=A0A1H9FA99_9HYPH|nr:nucleotide disphospho-sugar-binding domain-containing protein [Faunimonas pinastri]SEQ34860.1 UDP:flavonoid glycosyltransferase YjiC, YdhE family [Faunimonas pinastri]
MMSSPVALLAWELGAGLGHARRLLVAAKALQQRGFRPIVAARELWAATDEFHAAGIPLIQAPHHQGQAPKVRPFRARGFADMVAICGFARAEALWPAVHGWDGLFDLVRPDVVVADYSPVLSLAAYGRVPLVAIGDGFVLPPPHLPTFPLLREGSDMPGEAELLANAAKVQDRRGLPAPATLPGLIGGDAHVVCTLPETDIYADRRERPASGPLTATHEPLGPATQQGLFAYLAADHGLTPKLLQVLCDMRVPAEIFVRDAPDSLKASLRNAHVTVHDTPPPLPEALARAALVIHHGGIGTSESCLALGRPQVVLPRHFEQTLNARRLRQLGAAVALPSEFKLAEAQDLIAAALASESMKKLAEARAHQIADRHYDSVGEIAGHCEALAGRGVMQV